MRSILICLSIVLFFSNCNMTTKEPKTIEERVEKFLVENNVPCLSIGVVKNGEIELLKGFGHKSRNDTSKINENSIFQIASQSKMFTGIIVNNLIQAGKLNLEETITQYLPDIIDEDSRKAY